MCAAKAALSFGGSERDEGAKMWWQVGVWRDRKVSTERVSNAWMKRRAVRWRADVMFANRCDGL